MEPHPPIWRTRLAAVLLGWIATVLAVTVGCWRLAELAPVPSLVTLAVAVFAVGPLSLLIWGFTTMLREPTTGWLGPTVLLAFCGAFVPLARPLSDLGAQLNFMAHHGAYDAIVADAKARRLAVGAERNGWVSGEREGVRFRYRPTAPGEIEFPWISDASYEAGVRYDETPCRPTPASRCVARGEPLSGYYSRYDLIV